MDARAEAAGHDPVVVTGTGHVLGLPCDATPWLKVLKNRKFMGPQDELAVAAAGRALTRAGLRSPALGERAGLYMAVGYLPFERDQLDLLRESSTDAGGFSMARFSTSAFNALKPLLTFRCLSNMPAFHVSLNFDLQGPYFVTYPGAGQLYLALQEAVEALQTRQIDVALVCGVAHQRNALVEHHFARLDPPVPAESLVDAAGCFVLERAAEATRPVIAQLLELGVAYTPIHPFEETVAFSERAEGAGLPEGLLGPASLPVLLSLGAGGALRHEVETLDGLRARSAWGPP